MDQSTLKHYKINFKKSSLNNLFNTGLNQIKAATTSTTKYIVTVMFYL